MFINYIAIILMDIYAILTLKFLYAVIFLIIMSIFYLVLMFIIQKRINNFLIMLRHKKELCQSISFMLFIKNIFRNNFNIKTGNPKKEYVHEMNEESYKIEKFFNEDKNKNKDFYVITHKTMLNQLKRYEKDGLITITELNNTIKKKKTREIIIGKLDYIGFGSLINLGDFSYMEYIKTPFDLKKYQIHVNKK